MQMRDPGKVSETKSQRSRASEMCRRNGGGSAAICYLFCPAERCAYVRFPWIGVRWAAEHLFTNTMDESTICWSEAV